MKYKVGDKLTIIAHVTDHGFDIGEVDKIAVEVIEGIRRTLPVTYIHYSVESEKGDNYTVVEEEIKPHEQQEESMNMIGKSSFEGWKVRHIRANPKESKGGAVTILYHEIGVGSYAYKVAICEPNDNFNRKFGIQTALGKRINHIHNLGKENLFFSTILAHYILSNKLSPKALITLATVSEATL